MDRKVWSGERINHRKSFRIRIPDTTEQVQNKVINPTNAILITVTKQTISLQNSFRGTILRIGEEVPQTPVFYG
jgi:hypothetical protein